MFSHTMNNARTLLCLALLLWLGSGVAPTVASRALLQSGVTKLTGTAIVIHVDMNGKGPDRVLAVRTASGRRVQVQVRPEHASLLEGMHTGMPVTITGRWTGPTVGAAAAASAASAGPAAAPAAGTSFVAGSISARPVGAATAPQLTYGGGGAAAAAASAAAASAPPARSFVLSANKLEAPQVSTIIIPIAAVGAKGGACPGTLLPRINAQQIRQTFFQEYNPGKVTVGSTFNKCSYGKSKMTTGNSRLVDMVKLPCSGKTKDVAWTFDTCNYEDYNGYADAADEVLRSRGIEPKDFQHRVYLVPPGPCAFVGLGYVGCDGTFECRVWAGGDFWTDPMAIAHEIMHNLFLAHAGGKDSMGVWDEYADLSGTMGYCCSERCPNTPHAWQLGWIRVQQLDGTTLKAGQTVSLTVPSQSLSSRSGLRIVPTWAPKMPPLFVGYRTKTGGDAYAEADVAAADDGWNPLPRPVAPGAGRAHIYSSDIKNSRDSKFTTWEGQLVAPGDSWQHRGTRLVFRLKGSNRFAATISVCRKSDAGVETLASCRANQDADCNGKAGTADAACQRILKKVKRARAA